MLDRSTPHNENKEEMKDGKKEIEKWRSKETSESAPTIIIFFSSHGKAFHSRRGMDVFTQSHLGFHVLF